jgi:hypothetical protein
MDRQEHSLDILRRRAERGGVQATVSTLQKEFVAREFGGNVGSNVNVNEPHEAPEDLLCPDVPARFALGIGLHCCGSFTDMVMELCARRGAACIVAPCCNGKMGCFDEALGEGGARLTKRSFVGHLNPWNQRDADHFRYPRSRALAGSHSSDASNGSTGGLVSREEYLSVLCPAADNGGHYGVKCLIELDRALWAREEYNRRHWRHGFRVRLLKLAPKSCTPKHIAVRVS